MMKFISLASSSKGNCYLVTADGVAPLLIEAGIPIKRIREKLYAHSVRLSDLAGCLISHEHGDHSKAATDLLKAGVDCHMSVGTALALGIANHHRCMATCQMTRSVSEWIVLPFPLEHDAAEPTGFIIQQGGEKLLFIPDTAYVKNRFIGVTILAVECNHDSEILSDNISHGRLLSVVGRRIRRNHLSLSVVKDFILANNMQKTLREIHLLHLSDLNSSEDKFKREIEEITGVPVYVA